MRRFTLMALALAIAAGGCGNADQKKAEEAAQAAQQAAKSAEQAAKSAEQGASQAAQGLEQMAKGRVLHDAAAKLDMVRLAALK